MALKVLHTSQGQVRRRSTSLVAAAEYVGCWNNTWLLAAVGPANNTSLLAAIPAWWKKPSPVAQMATMPCQAGEIRVKKLGTAAVGTLAPLREMMEVA